MAIKIVPKNGASISFEDGKLVISGWHFETTGDMMLGEDVPPSAIEYMKQQAVLQWIDELFKKPEQPVLITRCFFRTE